MVISHTCNKEAEGNICLSEVSGGLCFYFSRLVFTVSLLLNCKFLCLLNVLVILLWFPCRLSVLSIYPFALPSSVVLTGLKEMQM